MCGRLRVGKENLTSQARSVQPCVRPLSAVGHSDRRPRFSPRIRSSGLCSGIRRCSGLGGLSRSPDRPACITCCSLLLTFTHAMVLRRDLVRPSTQLDNCTTCSPVAIIAQAIRASLLASTAMAATSIVARLPTCCDPRPILGAMELGIWMTASALARTSCAGSGPPVC